MYVVRREGYVLTRVCPSVCPHLGGYPGQVQTGVPQPGLMGGTPAGGVPHLGYPCQTWLGVPLLVGHLGYPWSDLTGGGTPAGGTPARGVHHLGYPPSDLAGGIPLLGGGTPPWVPPIGSGRGGYPTSGKRWST